MASNAVLSLHDALSFVGIPLWLLKITHLDLSLVPLTLVLNALITIATQMVWLMRWTVGCGPSPFFRSPPGLSCSRASCSRLPRETYPGVPR